MLAVDDDMGGQPAPADRTMVQPTPSGGTTVQREMPVHHVTDVSKLPSGGVASVENAVPGGTIVVVEKPFMSSAWEVAVVDSQGVVHKVHVDKNGQASNVRDYASKNDHVTGLTGTQKSAVMQRFPDAVIYDSEYAVVNGKRADKVRLVSEGDRYEVKVDRSTGEIYKVENDSQGTTHK